MIRTSRGRYTVLARLAYTLSLVSPPTEDAKVGTGGDDEESRGGGLSPHRSGMRRRSLARMGRKKQGDNRTESDAGRREENHLVRFPVEGCESPGKHVTVEPRQWLKKAPVREEKGGGGCDGSARKSAEEGPSVRLSYSVG